MKSTRSTFARSRKVLSMTVSTSTTFPNATPGQNSRNRFGGSNDDESELAAFSGRLDTCSEARPLLVENARGNRSTFGR
jgi:hypothetical protein